MEKSYIHGSLERNSPLRESGITSKIVDLFQKFNDERKASSLGLPMRGHLSTCVSSLLKNGWIYVKTGQIESCTRNWMESAYM